ncbi:MAG: [protein-PII] uridylyltransferase [Candidatus Berkiella sp.]
MRFIKQTHENLLLQQDAHVTLQTDIQALLKQRSNWLDEILQIVWRYCELEGEVLALIALGGYGLKRIYPGSDADILLLAKTSLVPTLQQKISRFVTAIWDCGIKLGSSVRTLDECFSDAKSDLAFYTNLLCMRELAGDNRLFTTCLAQVPSLMTFEAFLEAKILERQKRYQRFNHTEYGLEPNIKESPGGLRDLDLIIWLSLKKYHIADWKVLLNNADIDTIEYYNLNQASQLLWHIRYQLHLVSKGKSDRLYFEYQDKIASRLNFSAINMNEKMNAFMQQYYQTATELREITDILCQYFKEKSPSSAHATVNEVNHYCNLVDGVLEITDMDFLLEHPDHLLQLFALMAKDDSITNFSAKSLRFIRQLAKSLPRDRLMTELGRQCFMAILGGFKGAYKTLTLMHRLGLLSRYLPQMSQLEGQMQYDLFHLYTVDAHTLLVIRTLEWLFDHNALLEFKLPFNAKEMTLSPNALFLAGLLHDIGKGQGGNHSAKGAIIARQFCQDHQLKVELCDTVSWLVQNHLLMSEVAQHQDIGDKEVIERFSKLIKTPLQLHLLYLLTVADIYATNPALWNHWRHALLRDLYLNTLASLDNLNAPSSSLERLSPPPKSEASVVIKPHRNEAGTDIFIYAPENPNLLASILASLEKCNLTIVQARITTAQHFALQRYVVLEQSGTPIKDPARLAHIQMTLEKLIAKAATEPQMSLKPASRHIRRSLKFFKTQVSISIENKAHLQQTLITLHAPDFPGLLARVAQAFVQCSVTLHSALINTLDAKVEDLFYVTDTKTGQPLQEEAQIQALKKAITDAITEGCL